ncbi:hypothetical protein PIB30_083649, partial [Stylosanthes scabra]|nr:hypothetical protein [Stylosanthes scabra]
MSSLGHVPNVIPNVTCSPPSMTSYVAHPHLPLTFGPRLTRGLKRFLKRNHEITEEEEVKQSKVAWTEPQ